VRRILTANYDKAIFLFKKPPKVIAQEVFMNPHSRVLHSPSVNLDNALTIDHILGVADNHVIDSKAGFFKANLVMLEQLELLQCRAAQAGFDLQVASGFRSFNRQLGIWNAKAQGVRPVLDANGQSIDMTLLSDDEQVFAILLWSALPGASRHHWGTDVDVFDAAAIPADYQLQLTQAETEGSGPFAPFHRWLTLELQTESTDFFRPYLVRAGSVSPEPWHISYRPLSQVFSSLLTLEILREKILTTDIALKAAILKNLDVIFARYIKPYQ
jgi:LAS superfamily LD-carboxypeptidase LdcB